MVAAGNLSLLSKAYPNMAISACFSLFKHTVRLALSLAFDRAGNSMAARMAMMAITTSNSIKVKAELLRSTEQERFNIIPFLITQYFAGSEFFSDPASVKR